MTSFDDTPSRRALRAAVAALGAKYGHRYYVEKAKTGGHTTELWAEAGKLGYLGVSVPAEYGGGGGGITELAIVCEELAAAGCPLLLLVVSPAIVATIIAKHGTDGAAQAAAARLRRRHAEGASSRSPSRRPARTSTGSARWPGATATTGCISGRKCFISGVDEAPYMLVVARTGRSTGRARRRRCSSCRPTRPG